MSLSSTVRFIVRHPLTRERPVRALGRFVRWQIRSRVGASAIEVPFAGGTRLLVTRGMTGATGNIYCGLHEFEDMAFVLHALRPGDVFVDVGANIGSYTVLAAGAAGAAVLAIEPHPATFARLMANVHVNDLDAGVDAQNVALGAAPGVVRFSDGQDTENHVLAQDRPGAAGLDVAVTTLDEIVGGRKPIVLKIDVEGYETEVLRGAANVLEAPSLQAVLMELNGSGARYGFDERALHADLLARRFAPCRYDPFNRTLAPIAGGVVNPDGGNTLYVRDVGLLADRVRTAPRYRVLERDI